MDFGLNSALLIHVGALFYIIAFLIRDELKLRLMVLAGSAFYLLYYFYFPELPLWDAILTTCILVLANLFILFRILTERTVLALSAEEKDLFAHFNGFTPGQFRKLLKIADWVTADVPITLATEKQPLDKLYFIVEGPAVVKKGNHEFQLDSHNFVGEIAFILERMPSADVIAQPGARFVKWDAAELDILMAKSPAFQNALTALLSRDLADKLADSIQVEKPQESMPAV